MATYSVTLPITGYVVVEVEADSEKEAIAASMNSDFADDDIVEWEPRECIVEGNIFFGMCNRPKAKLIANDDED